ncbi:hypothetical protein F0562_017854 [Nyssa sinensis]|uniref:Uncharacterized protein n=1 Tax=Nyssa sinensis TaxID=561372 RepID=A0A5J4ZIY4_9ASTE|nr:hypothetical protein F0562_017854 [Nyssa sinensis]
METSCASCSRAHLPSQEKSDKVFVAATSLELPSLVQGSFVLVGESRKEAVRESGLASRKDSSLGALMIPNAGAYDLVPLDCLPFVVIYPNQGNEGHMGQEVLQIGDVSDWVRGNFRRVSHSLGMAAQGFEGKLLQLYIEIEDYNLRERKEWPVQGSGEAVGNSSITRPHVGGLYSTPDVQSLWSYD